MSVGHFTIPDDDVPGRLSPQPSVIITSALDSNTVISGMKETVLYEHAVTRLRVTAIPVRAVIIDPHPVHGNALAEEGMDDPEGRVEELDTLDKNPFTTVEMDQLRP
jgi:hypothetical protein